MLQPYFLPEKDGAVMNGDSKAGKMEMHLKDGYVAQLDYNELKKSGASMLCLPESFGSPTIPLKKNK
ncbi:MAG: hypothetical protein L0G39_09255 [Chryseobacterium sp.]|uniref:hypothetical protein n=1 Tax=Chryseobacterium carnipullorum TaxID=1124835 RepID=UPI0009220941|nr:hypothetical protein [Chryseobacterium carnipullorum]MDN5396105.1 hypothetical protein [Chryseobacterium sp.]MDN5422916.1 hypothetical protein [Chryseobacterium sp.]MDN5477107.1 hypothetical protein [Chryseobacterium sp.]SHL81053.1 hypothetical protein SAMN05444360_104262 [Chryseobacterium carnipullorum]